SGARRRRSESWRAPPRLRPSGERLRASYIFLDAVIGGFGLGHFGDRQGQLDAGALAEIAGQGMDRAAMGLHQPAADGKAETGAGDAVVAGLHAIEHVEDQLAFLLRNARSLVQYLDHRVLAPLEGADVDDPAGAGIFG